MSVKSEGGFTGVVYAPDGRINVRAVGAFRGAFVGGRAKVGRNATVYYDSALRGSEALRSPFGGKGTNGLEDPWVPAGGGLLD